MQLVGSDHMVSLCIPCGRENLPLSSGLKVYATMPGICDVFNLKLCMYVCV